MIKDYLEFLCKAYYAGDPVVSNEEYDALERIHGQVVYGEGDVAHAYRMYSLEKHYDRDGAYPIDTSICIETDKLDGAAVSLMYIGGALKAMTTRGNGIFGREIDLYKAHLLGIPLTIGLGDLTQITGEVVASKTVENSRNYASGALGLHDPGEFEERKTNGNMAFIAYNVQVETNRIGVTHSYSEDMAMLKQMGFLTVTAAPATCLYDWGVIYPLDGIVYRINDNKVFNSKGFTDKFPKGAFAHKEEEASVTTVLREVRWETGKSGKVAPTAYFDTVEIDEKQVSKATLNNIAYIRALDLEIGCTIEVVLAGKIIPKITGRV